MLKSSTSNCCRKYEISLRQGSSTNHKIRTCSSNSSLKRFLCIRTYLNLSWSSARSVSRFRLTYEKSLRVSSLRSLHATFETKSLTEKGALGRFPGTGGGTP